jgi:hypothetical protein
MQLVEVLRGNRIRFSDEPDRAGRAGQGADAATYAPIRVNETGIVLKANRFNRTYIHTGAATGALSLICFPNKIGGHQHIAWNRLSLDGPHRPAATSAAVAGMPDTFSGIIDEVHKAFFLTAPRYRNRLLPGDLSSYLSVDQIFGQVIVFDTDLKLVATFSLPDQVCRHPARAVRDCYHLYLVD